MNKTGLHVWLKKILLLYCCVLHACCWGQQIYTTRYSCDLLPVRSRVISMAGNVQADITSGNIISDYDTATALYYEFTPCADTSMKNIQEMSFVFSATGLTTFPASLQICIIQYAPDDLLQQYTNLLHEANWAWLNKKLVKKTTNGPRKDSTEIIKVNFPLDKISQAKVLGAIKNNTRLCAVMFVNPDCSFRVNGNARQDNGSDLAITPHLNVVYTLAEKTASVEAQQGKGNRELLQMIDTTQPERYVAYPITAETSTDLVSLPVFTGGSMYAAVKQSLGSDNGGTTDLANIVELDMSPTITAKSTSASFTISRGFEELVTDRHGRIYAVCNDKHSIQIFDTKNALASTTIGVTTGTEIIEQPPLLSASGNMYVKTSTGIYAFSPQGKLIWHDLLSATDRVAATPLQLSDNDSLLLYMNFNARTMHSITTAANLRGTLFTLEKGKILGSRQAGLSLSQEYRLTTKTSFCFNSATGEVAVYTRGNQAEENWMAILENNGGEGEYKEAGTLMLAGTYSVLPYSSGIAVYEDGALSFYAVTNDTLRRTRTITVAKGTYRLYEDEAAHRLYAISNVGDMYLFSYSGSEVHKTAHTNIANLPEGYQNVGRTLWLNTNNIIVRNSDRSFIWVAPQFKESIQATRLTGPIAHDTVIINYGKLSISNLKVEHNAHVFIENNGVTTLSRPIEVESRSMLAIKKGNNTQMYVDVNGQLGFGTSNPMADVSIAAPNSMVLQPTTMAELKQLHAMKEGTIYFCTDKQKAVFYNGKNWVGFDGFLLDPSQPGDIGSDLKIK